MKFRWNKTKFFQFNIKKKTFKIKLKTLSRLGKNEKIRKLIIDEGGVDYTEKKLLEISKLAEKELVIFEDSKYKESLKLVLNFNYKRTM